MYNTYQFTNNSNQVTGTMCCMCVSSDVNSSIGENLYMEATMDELGIWDIAF